MRLLVTTKGKSRKCILIQHPYKESLMIVYQIYRHHSLPLICTRAHITPTGERIRKEDYETT